MYEYEATVERVVDGDSLRLDVDLGLRVHAKAHVRLDGVDAPEARTDEGKAARSFVAGLVEGVTLTLRTRLDRTEKYGRWLAVLVLPDGTTVNDRLVEAGHARPYGGGRR